MRLIQFKIAPLLSAFGGVLPLVISLAMMAMITPGCHDKVVKPGGGGDDALRVEVWLLVVDSNDYPVSGAWVLAGLAGPATKRLGYTSPPGYFYAGAYNYDTTKRIEADIRKPGFAPVVDTFPLLPVEFQMQEIILPFDSCFVTAHVGFRIQDTAGNPVNGAALFLRCFPGCAWSKPFLEVTLDYSWALDSNPVLTYVVDSTRLYLEVLTSLYGFVDRKDTVFLVANDTVVADITLYPDGGK